MLKKKTFYVNCEHCESRMKSVFCDLNREELEALNHEKDCVVYRKGQFIFNQGSYPHGLYIINSGKVKITQLADNGKEQIVRLARKGSVLGYRALLSNDKYSCFAEALEETSVCFIPRPLFLRFIEQNGSVSSAFMKLLSDDLKNAEHKITDLAQKPVRERIAETLLYLKEVYGFENDGVTISVVLTREEIANIAGTATETSIRILSDLRHEKIIDFIGKKIKITNMKSLVTLANISD